MVDSVQQQLGLSARDHVARITDALLTVMKAVSNRDDRDNSISYYLK